MKSPRSSLYNWKRVWSTTVYPTTSNQLTWASKAMAHVLPSVWALWYTNRRKKVSARLADESGTYLPRRSM